MGVSTPVPNPESEVASGKKVLCKVQSSVTYKNVLELSLSAVCCYWCHLSIIVIVIFHSTIIKYLLNEFHIITIQGGRSVNKLKCHGEVKHLKSLGSP